jgi:hypothetical protein
VFYFFATSIDSSFYACISAVAYGVLFVRGNAVGGGSGDLVEVCVDVVDVEERC